MNDVPHAKCTSCGLVFPAPIFFGAGAAFGNAVGCIRCGGVAAVEDSIQGEIVGPRFVRDAINAVRGASAYDLEEFRRVADRARAGKISNAQAVEEARAISGSFAALMSNPAAGNWLALIAILVGIYIYLAEKHDGQVDHAEMLDMMRRQAEASEALADQYNAARQACPDDLPPLQAVPRRDGESRQVYRQRMRASEKNKEV